MRTKFILSAFVLLLFSSNLLAIDHYSGDCGRTMAYPKVDSSNLRWHLDTVAKTLTITGSGLMRDYTSDTRAPWYVYRNYFDTVWVSDSATCIGEMAFSEIYADSVHIGNAVQEVRSSAFSNSHIRSIVFPYATRYICGSACYNCDHLQSVLCLNGVETVQSFAFSYCDSLRIIQFGSSKANLNSYSIYDCGRLRTVTGTQVKSIDYYTFAYDRSLYNVSLGDSLTSIGESAFYSCDSLPMFVVPAATSYIGRNPFSHCPALDSLSVITGNSRYDSRNNCNAILETSTNRLISGCVNTVIPDDCVEISDDAFNKCNRLTSISIPASVATIKDRAFNECSSLLTVTITDSVSSVGCDAFSGCNSLIAPIYNSHLFARLHRRFAGTYTIPQGIVQITCGALRDCDSLLRINLPSSLRVIQSNAFYNCTRLDSVTIPGRVNFIGTSAFQSCSNLKNIILPDSITEISSYLFYYCQKLQSIDIPDAVYTIQDYAFRYCRSLKHVSIPANLGSIGNPFEGCDSLNSVIWNARDCQWTDWGLRYYSIDDALKNSSFHNTAFYPVRHNIKSFVIGDSVRVVPRFLCYEMDSITSLTIPANVDSIERCAFDYCNSLATVNWNARRCNSQISYIYAPFYTIDTVVTTFNFGDSVRSIPAYLCHSMSNLRQLHIPSLVSYIGPYAFRFLSRLDSIWVNTDNVSYDCRLNCNALLHTSSDSLIVGCWKTVIPSDTRSIAPYAFRNVQRLTKAVIPEGVSYIGEEAFNGCTQLDSVTLPTCLKAIRDYTFQACDSLRFLRMPDSLLTVGLRAFSHCYSLPTLSLPASLTSIDDYAFSYCTGLLDIYCNADTPPAITDNTFDASTCPIYVPCPEVNTYRNAPVWYDIRSRINGQYYLTFDARPNDYSFGDVIILQQPNCESSAKVQATPVTGYDFLGWVNQRGDTMSLDSIFELIPTENLVLTAVFQLHVDPAYGISVIARPDDATHGSASVVVLPDFDRPAEVEAHPASNYQFLAWTKDDGDTISYDKYYIFDPDTIYNDGRDTVVVIAIFSAVASGIDNTDDNPALRLWTDHHIVNILPPDNDTYRLYNLSGALIDSARGSAGDILRLRADSPGIYIVRSSKYTVKVSLNN